MTLDPSLMQRAAPAGSMRYFAWLYTPAPLRDVIAALFLIEAELHDTARAPHDVAHIRLQWWREEVDRLIADKAQHPATQLLQKHKTANVDFTVLHSLLLSTAQDLAKSTYESDTELQHYLHTGSGSLFSLTAQYLATSSADDTLLPAAQQLGALVRYVEVMRDLRQDIHHGRLYLPLSALDEMNIEYESLQSGHWPPVFNQWLVARCKQQIQDYRELKRALLAAKSRTLRPLLVLTELHIRLLEFIAIDPNQRTQQRTELAPFSKFWTAWRTARASQ